MGSKISAVIITKNEEVNISRCIRSIKKIADEILIVDSGSEDKTIRIAKNEGANVISTKWLGYAKTKNFGNANASHDYILSIDADEELSEKLTESILLAKNKGLSGTYSLNRKTNYCGKWINYLGWYPDEKIRLFDKRQVKWTGDFVHEELIIPPSENNSHLEGDLNHYSYTSKVDHRNRADLYSSLTAKKLFSKGKKASVFKPLISSFTRFIKMYFIKLGFLDGKAGLDISVISAKSNHYKYRELQRLSKKEKLAKNLSHICISRVDSIGDVMLTLPLLGVIKENFPSTKITFLGKNYTKDIINCCSSVNEFISYDELNLISLDAQKKLINKQKFDAVIHVLHHKELAKLFFSSKVPIRLGSRRKWYNLLYCNYWVNYSRRKSLEHESQLNIKMLDRLHCETNVALQNIPSYYHFKANKHSFPVLTKERKKHIILHPKSQGSAPEWPTEKFQKLAYKLAHKGYAIYITGTDKEGELIKPFFQFTDQILNCTGKFSLGEFISFISQADLLIAASTGPTHISAALGVNTLGLYSNERPAFPQRWGPVGTNSFSITGSPLNGLLTISVHDVEKEIDTLMSGS